MQKGTLFKIEDIRSSKQYQVVKVSPGGLFTPPHPLSLPLPPLPLTPWPLTPHPLAPCPSLPGPLGFLGPQEDLEAQTEVLAFLIPPHPLAPHPSSSNSPCSLGPLVSLGPEGSEGYFILGVWVPPSLWGKGQRGARGVMVY